MATFDAAAQVAATNNYVSHLQGAADSAIARLTDQATTWTYTNLNAVAALSLGTLAPASGTKPSLLSLTLPAFTPSDFTLLDAPVLPAPPSLAAGTAPMWNETFWSNLKTGIATYLDQVASSDDIDTLVNKLSSETDRMQSALYAKDYERRNQSLMDLYSAAESNTAAKGFSYPNSMTVALKLDAQQKFQFDLSQVSRDLITHVFEWAKSNWQFSLQQGIAAHNADVDFNTRYLTATIQAYQAQVTALVESYRSEVAALVSETEGKVREYQAQVTTELEKQKTIHDIQLKDASFDVEVAKANATITGEEWRVKVADFEARVRNFLETAKTNIQILDDNAKNRIQAAATAAQACASMAGAVGTITVNTAGA